MLPERFNLLHLYSLTPYVIPRVVGRAELPCGHEHINMLGRYAFTLPDQVARGELRPLRNPTLMPEDA